MWNLTTAKAALAGYSLTCPNGDKTGNVGDHLVICSECGQDVMFKCPECGDEWQAHGVLHMVVDEEVAKKQAALPHNRGLAN